MENILKYYEFSVFKKDMSGVFSGNEISYTALNSQHFLIFEKEGENYNLYVSQYTDATEIGKESPQILELLVENYDKSNPKHRISLRKYLG